MILELEMYGTVIKNLSYGSRTGSYYNGKWRLQQH